MACGGDDSSPVDPTPEPPTPPQAPNQLPTAAFTASVEVGSAPVAVSFNAAGSSDPDGTISSYAWTFGDGTTGSGAAVTHTFSQQGLFVVELTVRDDRSGEDAAKDTVFVSSPPGSGQNSISGLIWFDRNLDGDQDTGEPGLARSVVFLDDDADGERDASETLVFTEEDGTYAFTGLDAGTTYRVTQELGFGWSNTTPGLAATAPPRESGPARIIGGVEADIAEFPFQVALLQGDFQFCGGTLINSLNVLTAAHCVDDLTAGEVDILIGTADVQSGGQRVAVTSIRTNPNFGASLDYDVAVLRLERPLLLPRAFLQTRNEVSLSEPGTIATAIGWGQLDNGSAPNMLHRVELPILTNAACSDIAGEYYGTIGVRTLCAGGRFIAKGVCFGDSGGPLLVPSSNGWTQVGIASFITARDACANVPGAFSRVSELMDYIVSVARIETSGAYVVSWSSGSAATANFGNFH